MLTRDQQRDIHMRDRNVLDTLLEVGPDAAAAIFEAYKAGKLPMQKASLKPSAAPQVETYLANGPQLRLELAERKRLERAIKNPSLLKESDLQNYRFLNQLFFALNGPGGGTLLLAGISVTKNLIGYSSNSGKSKGWSVTFTWTGSDGSRRMLENLPPSQASNRRNDPERKWGLHD